MWFIFTEGDLPSNKLSKNIPFRNKKVVILNFAQKFAILQHWLMSSVNNNYYNMNYDNLWIEETETDPWTMFTLETGRSVQSVSPTDSHCYTIKQLDHDFLDSPLYISFLDFRWQFVFSKQRVSLTRCPRQR